MTDTPEPPKPIKKRKERSTLLDRVLFGCSSVCFHVWDKDATANPKLFHNEALNRVIFFKYPNYTLSPAESPGGVVSAQVRPIETAIFVPYNFEEIDQGGHGIYLRQRNYQELMLLHLGFDVKSRSPETLRDLAILDEIDRIPSLDPFLLKNHIRRIFPDVDPIYFDITDDVATQTRAIIAAKVRPIVERALSGVPAATRAAQAERFLSALWDPTLPEAELFIKAFGINPKAASGIFDALKGLSFYQSNIGGNNEPIYLAVRWLQSQKAVPFDMRQFMHQKEAYDMFRRKVALGIRDVSRIATNIFAEYDAAHSDFVKSGDPKPFRQFLETAHTRYWMLGYASTAVSQISYLFNNTMLEANRGSLGFERAIEMLSLMSLSMMDKSSAPDQGGA